MFARRDLRQRDPDFRTLAVTGYWRGATGPEGGDFGNTLLEAYENGVAWSVPLHNGLRNVTLLVDWSEGRHIRELGRSNFYLSEMKLSYPSTFVSVASLPATPRVSDATLYTARQFAGERFLLLGDAGLFIDPLSSEGVQTAMASAITGAVVINTILNGPAAAASALTFYRDAQNNAYLTHYRQSAEYYDQERRWPDSVFWRKRSGLLASARATGASGNGEGAALKPPSQVSHVRSAPDVRIERRPVLEWPYVEMREVLVTDRNTRGLRFLHNVSMPALLGEIKKKPAVTDIVTGYLKRREGKNADAGMVRAALVRLYRRACLWRSSHTKSDQGRAEVRTVPEPVGDPAVAGEKHPRSSAQDARETLLRSARITQRRAGIVFSRHSSRPPIPMPYPPYRRGHNRWADTCLPAWCRPDCHRWRARARFPRRPNEAPILGIGDQISRNIETAHEHAMGRSLG